ncbi:MAG: 3-dehydroquinate synthase family protein, partial [Planctomyces sp.]
ARRVRWGVCVLRASEEDKTLESAGRALAEAARLRLERGDVVIAIGGGVVTDIAGFVAATYRRGVDVVQCPTTLLAMVDAAVGGKTGVNVWAEASAEDGGKRRLVKNAVGCFHQPVLVCCDVAMLRTLPEREFCSGLAECIKHGLIGGAAGDAKLLEWMAANMARLRGLDASALVELVTRNVAIKSRVVRGDPLERSTRSDGGRMMLNLGHTFAHAIETLGGLSWRDGGGAMRVGPLKHGEAVGLGLLAAVRASEAQRMIRRGTAEEVRSLLEKAGLPTRVMGLPPSEAVVDRMKDDKKVMAGRLRLILPTTGRKCRVVEGPDLKVVQSAVDSLRAE